MPVHHSNIIIHETSSIHPEYNECSRKYFKPSNHVNVTWSRYLDGRKELSSDKTAGKDRRKRRGRDSISRETRVGAGNYRDYTIIIIDRPLNLRIC